MLHLSHCDLRLDKAQILTFGKELNATVDQNKWLFCFQWFVIVYFVLRLYTEYRFVSIIKYKFQYQLTDCKTFLTNQIGI